jgi:peptidoglycan hydrolase CwlO-like protein
MELSNEISKITSSKISIADAVNQLEMVKTAFQKSEKIEHQLEKYEQDLNHLRISCSSFITSSFLSLKLEDFLSTIEKLLSQKFNDFSQIFCNQLDQKVSNETFDHLLQTKVGWSQFSSISQQVSLLQSRVDKHIYSDFEGFKTKMKLELASKASESKSLEVNNEDFAQMKNKLVVMEQKLEELFMEDDAMQDDEYDSQEEMDNMMEDIDVVAKREETASNEAEVEQSTSPDLETSVVAKSDVSLRVETNNLDHFVEDKKTESPKIREFEKPVSRQSRARGSSIGGDSKTMQRRGSKESSIAASRTLGAGGLKQINRKLISLQKELETTRTDLEDSKSYTKIVENNLNSSKSYIDELENNIKNMHNTLQTMETSFIRALRRNGLDKKSKPKETSPSKLSRKDLESIDKKIEEKFKRLIILETDLEKISSETHLFKKFYKEKINEIIINLKTFDDFKSKVAKDLENLANSVERNIKTTESNFSDFSLKVKNLNSPLVDLISDQKRENLVLYEEVRRHQELFRAIVEEYSFKAASRSLSENPEVIEYANRYSERAARTGRRHCETPETSLKSRFCQKESPRKIDSAWLKSLPDGKAISLPRVAAKDKLMEKSFYKDL